MEVIRAEFDGGRKDGIASAGWILNAGLKNQESDNVQWLRITQGYLRVGDVTVMSSELNGAYKCLQLVHLCALKMGYTNAVQWWGEVYYHDQFLALYQDLAPMPLR